MNDNLLNYSLYFDENIGGMNWDFYNNNNNNNEINMDEII